MRYRRLQSLYGRWKNICRNFIIFDAMRQNIEIFLQVGEEDEEQIHEILERDWEKAHAPLVGVQCYDFQESHPEAEAGTCVYFANLLTEIGRFFEPMSMLGVF